MPPRVRRELLSKPESETREIERALDSLIQVREVPALVATTKDAVDRLDPGERDAVGLAAALDEETLLVMDDQAGRSP
ncbi:putative nucleic acid-binding protein [Salinibacter ruber]|nr:putative nucleic acid-binding protein [Salinibacter ruber]